MRAIRARRALLGGLTLLVLFAMSTPARADSVTDWNATAAAALQSPGTAIPPGAGQGAVSGVHLAMVHGAVYDAVNAIAGGHEPLFSAPVAESWYSQDAAVAAAARHVLLNGGPNGAAGFAPARVTAIEAAYALHTKAYADDFNEVKDVGSASSTTRTDDQTLAAQYWGAGNATATIASLLRSVAATQGGTVADHARRFALAYANAADAAIVTWRDKARYSFWRPITAIREAASDGNAATEADTTWTSLITAPPYPDHPSGLSGLGCSVAESLQYFFGRDAATFSGTSPASTRTFTSFSQMCDDIVDARVWSGIHFRFADTEAEKLGRRVAHWGNRHAFR